MKSHSVEMLLCMLLLLSTTFIIIIIIIIIIILSTALQELNKEVQLMENLELQQLMI